MIIIGQQPLRLADIEKILFHGARVELDTHALQKAEEGFDFLRKFSKKSIIYGVNTGLGPMAQYRIAEEEQLQLQYNLIRSHCAGSGKLLPKICIKALMVARLSSLMRGYSAIGKEGLILLKELINNDIYPNIYEHGGVGASGDLVQLAHLALALIGEGEARYKDETYEASALYAKLGLRPAKVALREGLAVMNGTSAMTGIGLVNLLQAYRSYNWSLYASCMINEVVGSFDDHFSQELNSVKLHAGQQQVAADMRRLLEQSRLIRKRHDHLYNKEKELQTDVFADKVQEYYSLRCVPQIMGPILETLQHAERILMQEVNSANDNPITDVESGSIFHGGNFHGDYVSLEMDKVKIVITKLSMLMERQLNFLMNRNLNGILPPFANLGKLGFNFGMQGAQFTATSTTAENQTLCFPMYVHSIPNNNDNQDIVSMGANSALICRKVVENTFEILAVHFISIAQAIDFLGIKDKMAPKTRALYENIREIVPVFESDHVKYPEIQSVRSFLLGNAVQFDYF